ncbi:MAG: hypothetical protein IKK21_09575 [Clostridia bacterium]|nr:hypothetical protein [Clostridia bacterium]
MRKILSIILCAVMLLSCVAVASAEEAVKTGLAILVSNAGSKNATADAAGVADSYIKIFAVTVDDNGVIDACKIDYIQAKINFNAAGEVTTAMGTVFASKIELDDAYGMRKASPIQKEWDEQANAFADYCVGKTVEELKGIAVNEAGKATGADLTASVTIPVTEFIDGVEAAVAAAAHLGAQKGDELKLTSIAKVNKAQNATADADGATQTYGHMAAITKKGDVITSAVIDAIQANVTFNAKGEITSDIAAPVITKLNQKDDYGMRKASPIQKEWFEQSQGFCAWITGKTVAEALAVAVNESGYPTEADVITSCTMNINDMLVLLKKAQ